MYGCSGHWTPLSVLFQVSVEEFHSALRHCADFSSASPRKPLEQSAIEGEGKKHHAFSNIACNLLQYLVY